MPNFLFFIKFVYQVASSIYKENDTTRKLSWGDSWYLSSSTDSRFHWTLHCQ